MTHRELLTSFETLIQHADRDDCAVLIGELERMKALAWGKIMARPLGKQNPPSTDLLTMAEAATRLSIPESRAYDLARQKKLPAVRIGKYVRVSVQALAEY